ncbi:MAG: ATP-binding protein [Bradymonadaceae bacterium]
MPLIDRTIETTELHDLATRPGHHLAILYGRRRIGKTFLLSSIWGELPYFYYLASDTTPAFNRHDFLRELATFTGDDSLSADDLPSWRFIFRELFGHRPDEPLVVVLDEFQYLLGGEDDIRSQLVAVWDRLEREGPLLVVLSGSAVSTMSELDGSQAALYGRIDWKRRLRPFDYWYAAQMMPYEARRDLIIAYAVFGGTPEYLSGLTDAGSLKERIIAECLSPRGRVRHLVETVIEQERGLRNVGDYRTILAAVARGRTTLNEIADLSGLPLGTGLRRKVQKLEELDLILGRRNFDAPKNDPYRYHLADPALRFNQSVVQSLRNELETTDPAALYDDYVEPRLQTHVGHIFEEVVRQAYLRLAPARALPLIRQWCSWDGLDRDRRPVEIDIVARQTKKAMTTGAVKWSRRPIGPGVFRDHLLALQRLTDSGYGWARQALARDATLLFVSAAGFDDAFLQLAATAEQEVLLWTLEDLFSPDAATAPNLG